MIDEKCGCGRPVRYYLYSIENGSCNKYQRCKTYEELEKELRNALCRIRIYSEALNNIDNYFEGRNESKEDRKKVYQILGNLTDSLSKTK